MEVPSTETSVLIVDDHETVRDGVKCVVQVLPGWTVCGTAETGLAAIELAVQFAPNVVVLDLVMPGLGGIDVTRHIRKVCPETEIVIFTGHFVEASILEAFDAGARSYILKTDPMSALAEAMQCAANHKPCFTPRVAEIIFSRFSPGKDAGVRPGAVLSERERQVIRMIAEGATNKVIAETIGISLRTLEMQRGALMKKLHLSNSGELIRYAIRNRIAE